MTARRASSLAVASVVVIALLVVLLAAWASSIGPGSVLRGTGPSPVGTPTLTDDAERPPADPDGGSDAGDGDDSAPAWLRTLAFLVDLILAVAAVLLALWLARGGVRTWRVHRQRRRRLAAADDVDFQVIDPPARVAREMLADAEQQRQTLLDGTPRNAVVACWHRFESQAAAAGLERRPWETSSEFTMRVLDLVDAYEPAVSRLGALYREARFSVHELTESDRREALEALDTIHRTIGVRA